VTFPGDKIQTMKNILKNLYHRYRKDEKNFGSFKIDQHIIIFDSDDWGCQRIHGRDEKNFLSSYPGFRPHDPFEDGDVLETSKDFENLSHLLLSFKDSAGRHPIFTLNYVVNNLKYSSDSLVKKEGAFQFESLTNTYVRMGVPFIWDSSSSFNNPKVFAFSLHAFAHLNQTRFLNDISSNSNGAKDFYNNGVTASTDPTAFFCYMDEMGGGKQSVSSDLSVLSKAINQFSSIFGERSLSFTPSCGVIEKSAIKKICTLGNFRCLKISDGFYRSWGGSHYSKHPFRTGQKIPGTKTRFLCRNCDFEPIFSNDQAVELCLNDINNAFSKKKPAIISTHRMNYVCGFDEKSYLKRMAMLSDLLSRILSQYPDAVFMSSDEFILRFF
jgi:hypothetical protein